MILVLEPFLRAADQQQTPPAAVLLDAYHPAEYGGTGVRLDPNELARRVADLGDVDWILAGGLTSQNVDEAIGVTKPAGVDTASGVESAPGIKDAAKVSEFARNAADAFRKLGR